MTKKSEELKISETYLKEMLKADDAGDFELYVKRYEKKYLKEFTHERFSNDIKYMHESNGLNTGYEFLSTLRNSKVDDLDIYRSVWRGVYEKRDAVIEIGVYKKNNIWHVIKSAVY
jgi:hypothetical protein